MIRAEEALSIILSRIKTVKPQALPLLDSIGNFLSANIVADRNYPPFNRAAVDGIAFYWDGTSAIPSSFILKTTIYAGDDFTGTVEAGECVRIMTGAPVPKTLNVLVRVEEIIVTDNIIQFKEGTSFSLMQNIAREGEDLLKGSTVLTIGTRVSVHHAGMLASLGYETVPCFQSLSASIIRTGNEITAPGQPGISQWQIRDSNSFSIRSLLRHYPIDFQISAAKDTLEDLMLQIHEKKESDILILTGGVSAGDADYVPEALTRCGFTCHFHKVQIKPGKPIWFGTHPNGCVAFGLPGNPYSVQVGIKIFIEPFIRACFQNNLPVYTVRKISHDRQKKISFEEYMVAKESEDGVAVKKHNGSGDISATLFSDGIMQHPQEKDLLKKGDSIRFYPWLKND